MHRPTNSNFNIGRNEYELVDATKHGTLLDLRKMHTLNLLSLALFSEFDLKKPRNKHISYNSLSTNSNTCEYHRN